MTLLLYGKERFLKDEAIAELKAKFFRSPSELDLNFQAFDAEEHGAAGALDFLLTAPFLASKRLAVLRHVDKLEEEEAARLLAAIDGLPDTACLVLETEETNTKKKALIRDLAEKAETRACHTPFDKDLPGWIETRARKRRFTLERGVAAFLLSRVGADLGALDGALNDLALYVHPRQGAGLADAQAITPSNPDEDVYKLADLLLESRKKEALSVVDGLYRSGARTPEIVGALAGQLDRYRKALALASTGLPQAAIADQLRLPAFPAFVRPQFFERLKGVSEAKLGRLQKALLSCDESFKTGRAGDRISVERFVLAI